MVFNPPDLTFGVELEFVYAVRNDHLELLRRYYFRPNSIMTPAQASDATTVYTHIANMLSTLPPHDDSERPSPLGHVIFNRTPKVVGYTTWSVTSDSSIGSDSREIQRNFDITREEADGYATIGVEVVSCVLPIRPSNLWSEQLLHVNWSLDMQMDKQAGAYCNRDTGLHVHFAFAEGGMPLLTLKNLLACWAVYEDEIAAMHPWHRRNNDYAQSLRVNFPDPFDPHEFTRVIFRQRTIDDLLYWVQPRAAERYSKINVSPPRYNKGMTVEFREHRGTIQTDEITWWVKFCEATIKFAHFRAQAGIDYMPVIGNGIPSLDAMLNLEDEGRAFLDAKKEEYSHPESEDDDSSEEE